MAPRPVQPTAQRSPSRPRRAVPAVAPVVPSRTPSDDHPLPRSYLAPLSQPHTLVVLAGLLALLVYAIFSSAPSAPGSASATAANARRGIVAALVVSAVFSSQFARDTLFSRPHPAVWRAATSVGWAYIVFVTFVLFQSLDDARRLLLVLDPELTGLPLPQRSYGDACALTLPNIRNAVLDIFTVAHLVGWMFKAVMLRDFWIAQAISVLFELAEYSLAYLLPNFNECWWDHWLLDFAGANMAGILLGHALLAALDSRVYHWSGSSAAAAAPAAAGGAARTLQLPPASMWRDLVPDVTRTRWRVFSDARRFALVAFLVAATLTVELNAFFLKDILWVPPPSPLNVYRLVIWWVLCMPGIRDYYAFVADPRVRRVGASAWLMLAAMSLELLVVVKFGVLDHYAAAAAPPRVVVVAWTAAAAVCGTACAAWFGVVLPRIVRRTAAGEEPDLSWRSVRDAVRGVR